MQFQFKLRSAILILALVICCTLVACSQGSESGTAPSVGTLSPGSGGLEGGQEATEGDTAGVTATPAGDDAAAADRSRKDLSQGDDADCAGMSLHTIAITPASLSAKEGEQLRTVMITVSGGSGEFKWYTPSMPEGVLFQKGEDEKIRTAQISGKALQPGAFTIPIKVRDRECHRDAQENFALSVAADPGVTPVAGPPAAGASAQLPAVPPRVRLASDKIEGGSAFLFPTDPEQQGYHPLPLPVIMSNPAAFTLTVTDRAKDGQTIESGRYTIKLIECPLVSVDDAAATKVPCFHQGGSGIPSTQVLNNPAPSLFAQNPYQKPKTLAYKRFIIKDTKENKVFYYDVVMRGRCELIPLREAYIRMKGAFERLEDKGYCNTGGKNYNTWAGFSLSNAANPSENGNDGMNGAIFRESFKLTSDVQGEGNKVATNPRAVEWAGKSNMGMYMGHTETRQCLEQVDRFGIYFDEDGCSGGKPDFFVTAIEAKVCRNQANLASTETSGCYFAGWKGRIGWNEVGDYDTKVMDTAFPEDEEGAAWSEHRNPEVISIFSALGASY